MSQGRARRGRVRGASAALLVALALALTNGAARADEVTIFAAASTRGAVEELAARYSATTDDRVRPVFAASSTLAKQITQGAPADLFLSANAAWMDYLANRGAIDGQSRRDLLGNRLVLIVPREDPVALQAGPGFALREALGERPLAVADPGHVPAGIYAETALRALGVWPEVAQRTVRTSDVRAALALVDRGEAAAGIVYATDAAVSPRVRIAATFPAESHPPITYPIAVVRGHGRPAVDRFHAFLLGPEAAAVFRAHGFLIPSADAR